MNADVRVWLGSVGLQAYLEPDRFLQRGFRPSNTSDRALIFEMICFQSGQP